MDLIISRRIQALGVTWDDVTAVGVYTVHAIESFVGEVILDRIGEAAARGLRWFHARPPIVGLEFEMDARGVRQELYL